MLQSLLDEIAVAIDKPKSSVELLVFNNRPIQITDFGNGYIKGNANGYVYEIKYKHILITQFRLLEFPSCCAFAISTQVYVAPLFQRKGVNKIANRIRQALAKADGYTALICTDVDSNYAERRTLLVNGWKDIYQTRNNRTGNLVNISVKEL